MTNDCLNSLLISCSLNFSMSFTVIVINSRWYIFFSSWNGLWSFSFVTAVVHSNCAVLRERNNTIVSKTEHDMRDYRLPLRHCFWNLLEYYLWQCFRRIPNGHTRSKWSVLAVRYYIISFNIFLSCWYDILFKYIFPE